MALDPFGPSAGLDPSQPVAGLDPFAPDPNAPGAFRRGFGAGVAGVKSSLYGAGALTAHGAAAVLPASVAPIATGLEKSALDAATVQNEVAAQQSMQFEDAVNDPTRAGEYFKWLLGNAVPSLATMAVGGGLGALAGRAVAGSAALAAARAAGVVAPAVRTGAFLGAVAPDVAMESGSIYPEALKTGVENPALRAAAGGALAASADFVPLLAAEKYLKPVGRGGIGALVKGALKGAPVGAGLEGSQELIQSVIERVSAGQSLTDPAAISDYINSFAGGAAPGALFGAGIGAHRKSAAPVQETTPPTNREQAPAVSNPETGMIGPNLGTTPNLGPVPPISFAELHAQLTAEHGAAAQQVAALEPAIGDAQTAHDALVAQRDALTEEGKKPVGERRTKSELTTAKKELNKQIQAAKANIETLGGSLNQARSAVAELTPRIEAAQNLLQTDGTSEQVPTIGNLGDRLRAEHAADIIPSDLNEQLRQDKEATPVPTVEQQTRRAVEGVRAALGESPSIVGVKPDSAQGRGQNPTTVGEKTDIAPTGTKSEIAPTSTKSAPTATDQLHDYIATTLAGKKIPDAKKLEHANHIQGAIAAITDEAAKVPVSYRENFIKDEVNKRVGMRLNAEVKGDIADHIAKQVARETSRETVVPAQDTSAGQNTAGEALYDRADGSRYRMANGRPDFGGDLAPVGGKTQFSKGAVQFEGKWNENADRLVPRGKITWTDGPAGLKASAGHIGNTHVATLRKVSGGYVAGVQGWQWAVTPDSGTARFNQIPGDKITHSPQKFFKTREQAKRAVESILVSPTESHAALTQDEFDRLPEPAKFAAVDEFNRIMMARGTELRTRIREMLGDRAGLIMKTFMATPDSPIGSYTRVNTLKSVISMALNAKSLLGVADHEGFHAAEDLILSRSEITIIANNLKAGKPAYNQLVAKLQQYDRENGTHVTDEVTAIPAEARAYAFEFWRRGELQVEGRVATLWKKIQQFFEKVANAVRGLGFTSMEDIFTALDRGQFAERQSKTGQFTDSAGEFQGVTRVSQAGDQPWYRSALKDSVEASPTKAASAQDWKDQIKGMIGKNNVKQVEINEVGLNDWLDLQKGKVTKDQVMAFLGENGVRVTETVLGSRVNWSEDDAARINELEQRGHERTDAEDAEYETLITRENAAMTADESGTLDDKMPKFAGYQLPGSVPGSYRELVLTLPSAKQELVNWRAERFSEATGADYDGWKVKADMPDGQIFSSEIGLDDAQSRGEAIEAAKLVAYGHPMTNAGGSFESTHFPDAGNYLAHTRVNDRMVNIENLSSRMPELAQRLEDEGKTQAKVLFVEEIQSDRAQKGRTEGFAKEAAPPEEMARRKQAVADIAQRRQALEAEGKFAESNALSAEYTRAMDEWNAGNPIRGIAPAPFVTKTDSWTALVLKRLLRYAAEGEYDAISWTTGRQQFERWGSEEIAWVKHGDGWQVSAKEQRGGNAGGIDIEGAARARGILKEETGLTIRDKVGLRIAVARVLSRENNAQAIDKVTNRVWDRMQTEDAGTSLPRKEGMEEYYDKITPKVAKQVAKQAGGGKVDEININTPRGIEKQRYEGPEVPISEMMPMVKEAGAPVAIEWQVNGVRVAMEQGKSFREAMEQYGSQTLAEIIGGKMDQTGDIASRQQAIEITPEMVRNIAKGIPLFSRAAVEQMNTRFANGELEQTQQNLAVTRLIEDARSAPWGEMFKRVGFSSEVAGIKGGLSRWWHDHVSTPNFISAYSQGFKNVYTVLNTFMRFRDTTVEKLLHERIPEWYTASFADQDAASSALFKRSVEKYKVGTQEYNDLIRELTPEQKRMFDSATTMIGGMLDAELAVDTEDFKRYLTSPGAYDSWLANRTAQVQEMKDSGYVPLRRYGDHTVRISKNVTAPDGTIHKVTAALQMYSAPDLAEFAARMYRAEAAAQGLDYEVEVGIKQKHVRETAPSVQQFFATLRREGVDISQAERERLVLTLSNADSMERNRLLHREGVPGFSKDGERVLNEFGVNMASKLAYSKFGAAIDAVLEGLPVNADVSADGVATINIDYRRTNDDGTMEPIEDYKTRNLWTADGPKSGYFHNRAVSLTDYVLSPSHEGDWSRNARAAAMVYFIGGSISGAVVNTMSVPMLLVPQLSVHTNYANGLVEAMSAWKNTWQHQAILRDITRLKNLDNDPKNALPGIDEVQGLRAALIAAADKLQDTELHQIMAISQGQLMARSRGVRRALNVWMAPFRISEQTNRIASFIAGYKVGQANGLKNQELFNFARNMVDSTQNNYSLANRPGLATTPVGAMLFMFKSFPLFMIEAAALMYKANPRSAVFMLLGLTAMTGVQGLPFADTIMDLIDTISQHLFNSPFNARRAMRNVLKDASEATVGYDLSSLFMRGMINELLGVSASSRIGAGDFVPGSRLGTADADQGRILEQMLGAPYAMVHDVAVNAGKALGGVATGDWKQVADALRAGGPVAVRNAIKGIEQLDTGYASDSKGHMIKDVSTVSAILQLGGLSSAAVAKAYDLESINIQTKAFYTQVSQDIQNQLVEALKAGDTEKVQEINTLRARWNEEYPSMPILPNAAAVRRSIMLSGVPLDRRSQMQWSRRMRGANVFSEAGDEQ